MHQFEQARDPRDDHDGTDGFGAVPHVWTGSPVPVPVPIPVRGLPAVDSVHETVDAVIARLAESQAGVVSSRQLREAGVRRQAVAHRVRTFRMFELLPRVYAVGHYAWRPESVWWAAVLFAGPGARLAGRSGIEAHGWLRADPSSVSVVGPSTTPRSICTMWPGRAEEIWVAVRRSKVDPDVPERAANGLPTRSVARLVREFAGTYASDAALNAAIRGAEFARKLDDAALRAELGAGKVGATRLRAIMDKRVIGTTFSRSALEEAARDLWEGCGLPTPQTDVRLPVDDPVMTADFYWPEKSLVIEVDGEQQATPAAMHRDRTYDAKLGAAGIRVLRFVESQILGDPDQVIAAVDAHVAHFARARRDRGW